MSERSLSSCGPNWTRRFDAVWRRRLRQRKPEVGVDRTDGAEPRALSLYEDAPSRSDVAPEIWGRLSQRFLFYTPLKFSSFV